MHSIAMLILYPSHNKGILTLRVKILLHKCVRACLRVCVHIYVCLSLSVCICSCTWIIIILSLSKQEMLNAYS